MVASFPNTRSALRDLDSANFVRVRAWSVGDPSRKNTTYQASAPILIAISQASVVGGRITTRLLKAGTGSCARLFGNSFRSFVQKSEQPGSRFNVLSCQSPFVFAAVAHGRNHEPEVFGNVRFSVGKV